MLHRHARASANLSMLERVARKLADLNDEVVYLGGCATALFINDALTLDVRATLDVDCIVDIISLSHYHKFENQLRKRGFTKSLEDDVICRWRYDEIILDVMPTDEKILGFSNVWYKQAIDHPVLHQLADDVFIKSITAPFFLATKYEAFKTRGKYDYFASHDFEDMLTVIAGRHNIETEVQESPVDLRNQLRFVFKQMLQEDAFMQALPGHLNDGPITFERLQKILNKIKTIAANNA